MAYELRQSDELLLDLGFLTSYGYLGILLLVLAINLIPFASPSNLVLAGAVAYFTTINPIAVALIVAIAATLAKLVHYSIAAFFGKRINQSKGKLNKLRGKRNYGQSCPRNLQGMSMGSSVSNANMLD